MKRFTVVLTVLVSVLFAAVAFAQWAAVTSAFNANGHLEFRNASDNSVILEIADDGVTGGAATFSSITNTGALQVSSRTIVAATYTGDPNADEWKATIAGLDADDFLVATLNTAPGNSAYLLSAVPTVGGATVTMSADPAESVTITFVSYQD
jgi:hypothetical protein